VQVLDGAGGAPVGAWRVGQDAKPAAQGAAADVAGLHFLGAADAGAANTAELAAGMRVLTVTGGGRASIHAAAGGGGGAWEATASFQAAPSVAATVRGGVSSRSPSARGCRRG
jgi:hypothetical protein